MSGAALHSPEDQARHDAYYVRFLSIMEKILTKDFRPSMRIMADKMAKEAELIRLQERLDVLRKHSGKTDIEEQMLMIEDMDKTKERLAELTTVKEQER